MLTISLILVYVPATASYATNDYFIVTAYYSPLPDQDYYITGNYESEKRLNGNGIAGASGKKVFSGMLAAPGTYSFGTKIELDGLGVGSVEDRGGAIVSAGNRGYSYDRIDVWMGYGDEGLRRAMYWGKRKVAGRVIDSAAHTTLDYNSIPAPTWAVPKTTTLYGNTIQAFQKQAKEVDIFSISIGKGSSRESIEGLQGIFLELGYISEESVTGEYDKDTIDMVYKFQIEKGVVQSENSLGAGSYGPKTRAKLKESYETFLKEKLKEDNFFNEYQKISEKSLKKAENHIQSIGNPLYGEISPSVRDLQKVLAKIGYFDYKDTAIFGVKTKNSILEYQLKNKIIKNTQEIGAGVFGPKTRESIVTDISAIYLLNEIEEANLSDDYNRYILNLDEVIPLVESSEISISIYGLSI